MKRFSILMVIFLAVPLWVSAQDSATEEQLNKLRNDLATVQASNVALQKQLADVLSELQENRTQAAKPSGNYASAEDVKRLAGAIEEVDRKREADSKRVAEVLKNLGRSVASTASRPQPNDAGSKPVSPENGFEYVIQSGDTLSSVVAEYRRQGVKVTVDDVVKANPGLKPTSLAVGTKVFIPKP